MLKSFNRVVVQVDVSHFDVVQIEALRIHGEAVILRRDLDLLALDVQNRMIAAVMSELQLVSPAAQRESENLMPEANPEHRLLSRADSERS